MRQTTLGQAIRTAVISRIRAADIQRWGEGVMELEAENAQWQKDNVQLHEENARLREGIMAIYMPMHGDELRGVGQKLHALLWIRNRFSDTANKFGD